MFWSLIASRKSCIIGHKQEDVSELMATTAPEKTELAVKDLTISILRLRSIYIYVYVCVYIHIYVYIYKIMNRTFLQIFHIKTVDNFKCILF